MHHLGKKTQQPRSASSASGSAHSPTIFLPLSEADHASCSAMWFNRVATSSRRHTLRSTLSRKYIPFKTYVQIDWKISDRLEKISHVRVALFSFSISSDSIFAEISIFIRRATFKYCFSRFWGFWIARTKKHFPFKACKLKLPRAEIILSLRAIRWKNLRGQFIASGSRW